MQTFKRFSNSLIVGGELMREHDSHLDVINSVKEYIRNRITRKFDRVTQEMIVLFHKEYSDVNEFIKDFWKVYKKFLRSLPRKECIHRCKNCGRPATYYGPDPYYDEMYGDKTKVWLCERCFDSSMGDI